MTFKEFRIEAVEILSKSKKFKEFVAFTGMGVCVVGGLWGALVVGA